MVLNLVAVLTIMILIEVVSVLDNGNGFDGDGVILVMLNLALLVERMVGKFK